LSKLLSTKNNRGFLATVWLIAGIIALSSISSFMTSAQAIPEYVMNDKPFGKDGQVEINKCNDVNINIPGFEINELPSSAISALTNEASESGNERSNEPSSTDGFDGFICNIKNNNNNVGERDGDGVGTDQCGEEIESCFQQYLEGNEFKELSQALDSREGVEVDIEGREVTLRSFEDLCSALAPFASDPEQVEQIVGTILGEILTSPININFLLFGCIIRAL
jgi:hypothetical protein